MAEARRAAARYRVNIAVQAWDLAKAGSALTVKVGGTIYADYTYQLFPTSKDADAHSFHPNATRIPCPSRSLVTLNILA